MKSFSSEHLTRRRPDVFRALGPEEPPSNIMVGDTEFTLCNCLKHDSWAATALYVDTEGRGLACKLNRKHPLPGGIPTRGLGVWLAGREARVMRDMTGCAGFPRWPGRVTSGGTELDNAVAHWWIDGEPFRPDLAVDDGFFPQLSRMLSAFHATGRAYVDMSKWGNILIGADGAPSLLDYQIHFRASSTPASQWLLRQLQKGDWFYLRRHWRRCRPDQYALLADPAWSREPAHIWLAERVGFVFRSMRIAILRLHGVKGDPRRDDELSCAAKPAAPGMHQ
jgi:hypothetical protein